METLRYRLRQNHHCLIVCLAVVCWLGSASVARPGEPTGHPSYDRSSFGSPFAGQAFTMGDILRGQGQLPPLPGSASFNSASCLSISGTSPFPGGMGGNLNRSGWITYNLGTLGIVSPGWAWYPYYSPYNYNTNFYYGGIYPWGLATPYSSFGYPAYYNYAGLYFGNNLPYGWVPFWTPIVNPLVPNYGFMASVSEIAIRGNARFGAARPVRDLIPRNRNRGRGIVIPDGPAPGQPQQGMNAVPPIAPIAIMGNRMPMDPLKVDLNSKPDSALEPASTNLVVANSPAAMPRLPQRTARPGLSRNASQQKVAGKFVLSENATPRQREQWVLDRLQTGDRLARSGLMDEARVRYEDFAESSPDQPAPWFRLAQIEVLAGNAQAASKAWKEAEARSSNVEPGYTKRLPWSGIADETQQFIAAQNLAKWTSESQHMEFLGLQATLPLSKESVVTAIK